MSLPLQQKSQNQSKLNNILVIYKLGQFVSGLAFMKEEYVISKLHISPGIFIFVFRIFYRAEKKYVFV